jgi:hypothetical protein
LGAQEAAAKQHRPEAEERAPIGIHLDKRMSQPPARVSFRPYFGCGSQDCFERSRRRKGITADYADDTNC